MKALPVAAFLSAVIVLLCAAATPLPAQVVRHTLQEVWRSDPSAELTRVQSLDVDSRGRVYIAEGRSQPAVTILRLDGRLERRLGRAGDGPGEFREPLSVQVLRGDTLMVYDAREYRVSFFAPGDDRPVQALRLEGGVDGVPFAARMLPDGRLLVQLMRYYEAGAGPADDRGRSQVYVLADPRTGQPLGAPILRLPAPGRTLIARRGSLVGAMPIDFGDARKLRLAPDGTLVYGTDGALRFDRFDLAGTRIGGFDAPFQPLPFTRADLERELAQSSDFFEETIRSGAPEHWPSYADFQVDDRGRLFVTMGGTPTRAREVRIFEPLGRETGRFTIPPNTRIHRVIGARIYAVTLDEYEVPVIVRYALKP